MAEKGGTPQLRKCKNNPKKCPRKGKPIPEGESLYDGNAFNCAIKKLNDWEIKHRFCKNCASRGNKGVCPVPDCNGILEEGREPKVIQE